jgi:hypothetical protein
VGSPQYRTEVISDCAEVTGNFKGRMREWGEGGGAQAGLEKWKITKRLWSGGWSV